MVTKTLASAAYPRYPGGAVAVTPSDTINLTNPAIIYVGVAGTVKVLTVQGEETSFVGVLGGGTVPVEVIRVYATGTTATYMVAVY
tara:strand:- start:587 stop:844 length:258 start_codon:yes stop_codon:yes gene_type:complete